jgi:hypothetical protein
MATHHQLEMERRLHDLSPVENTLDRKNDDELEQKGTEARTSGRCRKHPITRKNNFLWSICLSRE